MNLLDVFQEYIWKNGERFEIAPYKVYVLGYYLNGAYTYDLPDDPIDGINFYLVVDKTTYFVSIKLIDDSIHYHISPMDNPLFHSFISLLLKSAGYSE